MEDPKSVGTDTRNVWKLDGEKLEGLKRGDVSVLMPAPESAIPTPKVLAVDPIKCNGCRLCETACSLYREGESDPNRARIRILEYEPDRLFLPVVCQQCSDAPCLAACPKEAISWQDDWNRVAIDYDRCVSCQMCRAACPYGAMHFDDLRTMVFKCDLCNGNPQCVHFCEPDALKYKHADDLHRPRLREAASIRRRY